MQRIDLLVQPRWLIPVQPEGVVLEAHSLAVRDGRIEAILPNEEAARQYSAEQTITLPDHALLPGLINAHTHAAMTLMRGLADDLPLMQWLNPKAWLAALAGMGAYGAGGEPGLVGQFAVLYFVICYLSIACWAYAGACMGRYLQAPGRLRLFNRGLALLLLGSAVYLLGA